ncbi:DUF2809 domain-containing protein [Paenibacillus mendelii]|nr:DUF2809 domain-containing protein [Paenibacillus mendelii]
MGYFIMLVIVIMLGLGSRMTIEYIPEFVSRHAGDALWASMIYMGFRILLTDRKKSMSVCTLLFIHRMQSAVSSRLDQRHTGNCDWSADIGERISGG